MDVRIPGTKSGRTTSGVAAACRTSREEKLSNILGRTVNPDVRGPVELNHRIEDESEIT